MTRFIRWAATAAIAVLITSPLTFGRGFGGGMRGGGGMGGGGMRGGMGGGGMSRGGMGGGRGGGGMGGARGGMGGGGMGGAGRGGMGGAGGGGFGGAGGGGFGGAGGGGFGGAGGGGFGGAGGGGFGGAGGGGFGGAGRGGLGGEGAGGAGRGGLGGEGAGGFGGAGRGGLGGEGAGGFGGAGRGGFGGEGAGGLNGRGGFNQGADGGLGRYSGLGNGAGNRPSQMWSNNDIANRGNNVRNNFNNGNFNNNNINNNYFGGAGWYGAHPGAWAAAGWGVGAAWTAASWATLAPMWGMTAAPMYYDYGNTVAYQGNSVYVNGDNVGSAAEYSQQATALAQAGQQAPAPAEDQWTPLGVFALESGQEESTNNLFQLAVDKSGTIRGNYYDAVTDETTPVAGSVDQKTQRAAWTVGDKTDRVYDTGIYNLTKDQTPVLVHTGNDKTQQLLLVRLQQQPQGAAGGSQSQ
ncbi:MAG: hypothetical protein U0992_19090 [Planctomycetaceae bacterium]